VVIEPSSQPSEIRGHLLPIYATLANVLDSLSAAELCSNEVLNDNTRRLCFTAPAAGHSLPGQYVTVTIPGESPGYFALANSPGEPIILLVKGSGEASKQLQKLNPGDPVHVSDALGSGFAMDHVAESDLVILCNGSGIAACRPVIRAELASGLSRAVHFYYGNRTLRDCCLTDEIKIWSSSGIYTHIVLSRPDATWTGERGYVQEVAQQHGLVRPDVALLLAGLPTMQDQASRLWRTAGLHETSIVTNF